MGSYCGQKFGVYLIWAGHFCWVVQRWRYLHFDLGIPIDDRQSNRSSFQLYKFLYSKDRDANRHPRVIIPVLESRPVERNLFLLWRQGILLSSFEKAACRWLREPQSQAEQYDDLERE